MLVVQAVRLQVPPGDVEEIRGLSVVITLAGLSTPFLQRSAGTSERPHCPLYLDCRPLTAAGGL